MENKTICYSVKRTVDTNMIIQVENGEVIVNAPWYVRENTIKKTIQEKKKWILNKIDEYEKNKTELMDIRPIIILGKNYNLKVSYKNIEKIECNLKENTVEVNLPKKYKKANNELITNVLMDKLYEKVAKEQLEYIMEKLRVNLGFAPEDYKIKEMKNCIAKCTEEKVIIVNPKIAIFNPKTIEYILLHQFCHLKYKNHVNGFWKMIENYMPEYKKYEIKCNMY